MKYIKGLDTLRAFAVILVIIEHWWLPFDSNAFPQLTYWIRGLVPDGGTGVHLFFVLSGYLITNILLGAISNHPEDKWRILKNFIIRRSLRIFPVYYATILVLLLIGYPDIKENLIWFLTYTSNILGFRTQAFNSFAHVWSLAVEEQFYLIWPWFIIFLNPRYLKYVFYGAMIIGVCTIVYTMVILDNWAGYQLMPSCMQAFGLGGLYAYAKGKPIEKNLVEFIKQAFPAALLAHFYFTFSADQGVPYNFAFMTVNSIISIWLIHRVLNNRSEWVRKHLLENATLNKIGQISYGLYLFHFALPKIYDSIVVKYFTWEDPLGPFFLDWRYNYVLRLVILFLIALGSYHFFEKPVMELKRKFNY